MMGTSDGAVYSTVPTIVDMRPPCGICCAVPKSVRMILAPGILEVSRMLSGYLVS